MSAYHIPLALPAISLELHPDGSLYVVYWAADLDQPIIKSWWFPLGISLDLFRRAYGRAGERLLHTHLSRMKEPGVYCDARKIRFILSDGAETKLMYRIEHAYLCPEYHDALAYE